MSTSYEVAAVYKGKTSPPNAGQGDLFVDQTTNEVRVHNGLRFSAQVFPSGLNVAGALAVGAGLSVVGGVSLQGGNLDFGTVTAQRLRGDFTDATLSNRLYLQSVVTNGQTVVGVIPNGTSTTAQLFLHNASDPDNAGRVRLVIAATAVTLQAQSSGTGTTPTSFDVSGFTSYSFDGPVAVPGGTSPVVKTSTAITSGAGAATGTLTNAPAAGNPTKWVPINDNGTTRYVPAW